MNSYNDPAQRRKILMDRYLQPRWQGTLPGVAGRTYQAEHCADQITLTIQTENGQVKAALFSGHGCVVAIASTDLVLEKMRGLKISDACEWLENYRRMIELLPYQSAKLGPANVLAKVGQHKNRQGCGLLIYQALHESLGC